MKTYFDCIPCFVRQALDAVRLVTDDAVVQERVLRDVLRLLSELDLKQTPPALAYQVHGIIKQASGSADPYSELKKRVNAAALELLPELEREVVNVDDPFDVAVRLAIAGNIIDFGFKSRIDPGEVRSTIRRALDYEFPQGATAELSAAAANADSILYLADNAGEIVFDRLLLEQLPRNRVALVVHGGPFLNDATREDAEQAGIGELVEVIDNGSDASGTVLETCSGEFRARFAAADLLIAKGMANYETLNESDRPIWFLFQVKCPVIAREAGVEVGRMLILRP